MGKKRKSHHRRCRPLASCDHCYVGPPIQTRVLAPAAYNVWPNNVLPAYTMDAGFSTDQNPPAGPTYYTPRVVGGFTQPYYDATYPQNIPGRVYDERNPYIGGRPIIGANPSASVNPGVFTTYDERSRGAVNP